MLGAAQLAPWNAFSRGMFGATHLVLGMLVVKGVLAGAYGGCTPIRLQITILFVSVTFNILLRSSRTGLQTGIFTGSVQVHVCV